MNKLYSLFFELLRIFLHFLYLLHYCHQQVFNFVYESSETLSTTNSQSSSGNTRKFSEPTKSSPRRICIIGAGASGLAALKTIISDYSNVEFKVMVFEKQDKVGGLWNYETHEKQQQSREYMRKSSQELTNKEGDDLENISPMYSSLHTNTSRDMMGFSDFPMPAHFPDFPSCPQVNEYLNLYALKFKLKQYIVFKTEVVSVKKETQNNYSKSQQQLPTWIVTTKNLETGQQVDREFDVVLVGNGRNTKIRVPKVFQTLSNTYKLGKVFHSKYYEDDYEIFKDKTVLVVGSGSSGSDIASRIALVTDNTYITVQKGASLIPKYLDGEPIDFNWIRRRYFSWIPKLVQKHLANLFVNRKLPHSKLYHPFNSNPSRNHTVGLSSELIIEIGFGRVKVMPPIVSFSELEINFENGKKLAPDFIVLCTGYELDFPFLDPNILKLDETNSSSTLLYENLFHMDYPNLIFLSLPFTVHPLLVGELQARYVVSVLTGSISIPSKLHIMLSNEKKLEQLEQTNINPRKFFHREYHLEYCDKLARLGGFYPNPFKYDNSKYFTSLVFGPLYGVHYRMDGPGKLDEKEIDQILSRYNSAR